LKVRKSKERERERECVCVYVCMNVCMYTYVRMNVHTYVDENGLPQKKNCNTADGQVTIPQDKDNAEYMT
jgi:hypothetical protein